jgi:hypothetical protein
MKPIFLATALALLLTACSPRTLGNINKIIIQKNNLVVAEIPLPAAGGIEFTTIDDHTIVIADFPAPSYVNNGDIIYHNVRIEILEKANHTVTSTKLTTTIAQSDKDVPLGGYGDYQVYAIFHKP